jgi:anti-sigma B factor antagonist
LPGIHQCIYLRRPRTQVLLPALGSVLLLVMQIGPVHIPGIGEPPMNTDLGLMARKVEDVRILELSGDVDEFTCSKLREALMEILAEGDSQVVVNLSEVRYMDSAGLGTLVGGLKRVMEAEGYLAFYGANPQVVRILRVTGLDRVLDMHDGEQSAMDGLKAEMAKRTARIHQST